MMVQKKKEIIFLQIQGYSKDKSQFQIFERVSNINGDVLDSETYWLDDDELPSNLDGLEIVTKCNELNGQLSIANLQDGKTIKTCDFEESGVSIRVADINFMVFQLIFYMELNGQIVKLTRTLIRDGK